jgi:glycosyltransferase involved in cell wall biosynthesis
VIIPFYNRSSTIERALRSVLSEGNLAFTGEVIIIDDGSTLIEFDTLNIILKSLSKEFFLSDGFINVIRYENNVNAAHARNVGIKNSKFNIIAFLDSDDEWIDNKLKIQIKAIHENNVVFSQFKKINIKNTNSSDVHPKYFESDVPAYILSGRGHIQTSTILLPRQLALKVLFNDSLKKYQDWDFAIRLFSCGAKFEFCKQPLVNYYVDSSDRIGVGFNYQLAEAFSMSISHVVKPKLINDFLFSRKVISYISDGLYGKACKLIFDNYFIFRLNITLKSEIIIYFCKKFILSLKNFFI